MSPATIAGVSAALGGIEESLSVYPPGFYGRLCKAIFISGPFTLADAGGTYGPNWIVLVADESDGEHAVHETARFGVHHEFSSLVLRTDPSTRILWAGLTDWRWPEEDSRKAVNYSNKLFDRPVDGFLNEYSRTTAENDFNTYVESMFLYPHRVQDFASDDPLVRKKVALVIRAYTDLDERMAAVFDGLGFSEFADPVDAEVDIPVPTPLEVPPPVSVTAPPLE